MQQKHPVLFKMLEQIFTPPPSAWLTKQLRIPVPII